MKFIIRDNLGWPVAGYDAEHMVVARGTIATAKRFDTESEALAWGSKYSDAGFGLMGFSVEPDTYESGPVAAPVDDVAESEELLKKVALEGILATGFGITATLDKLVARAKAPSAGLSYLDHIEEEMRHAERILDELLFSL